MFSCCEQRNGSAIFGEGTAFSTREIGNNLRGAVGYCVFRIEDGEEPQFEIIGLCCSKKIMITHPRLRQDVSLWQVRA